MLHICHHVQEAVDIFVPSPGHRLLDYHLPETSVFVVAKERKDGFQSFHLEIFCAFLPYISSANKCHTYIM